MASAIRAQHQQAANHERRDGQSVEQVTQAVGVIFDRYGIDWSRSRLSRTVRAYLRSTGGRASLGVFLADQIARDEMERRLIADELRRILSYSDPTGEAAVANVITERGY